MDTPHKNIDKLKINNSNCPQLKESNYLYIILQKIQPRPVKVSSTLASLHCRTMPAQISKHENCKVFQSHQNVAPI